MRDIVVVGACLVREQSSLKAFWYLARNWRRVSRKAPRDHEAPPGERSYISDWFSYQPVSHPAPKPSTRSSARSPLQHGALANLRE